MGGSFYRPTGPGSRAATLSGGAMGNPFDPGGVGAAIGDAIAKAASQAARAAARAPSPASVAGVGGRAALAAALRLNPLSAAFQAGFYGTLLGMAAYRALMKGETALGAGNIFPPPGSTHMLAGGWSLHSTCPANLAACGGPRHQVFGTLVTMPCAGQFGGFMQGYPTTIGSIVRTIYYGLGASTGCLDNRTWFHTSYQRAVSGSTQPPLSLVIPPWATAVPTPVPRPDYLTRANPLAYVDPRVTRPMQVSATPRAIPYKAVAAVTKARRGYTNVYGMEWAPPVAAAPPRTQQIPIRRPIVVPVAPVAPVNPGVNVPTVPAVVVVTPPYVPTRPSFVAGSPAATYPAHVRGKPGPGIKERKVTVRRGAVAQRVLGVLGEISEIPDMIDALHDALPKKFQAKPVCKKVSNLQALPKDVQAIANPYGLRKFSMSAAANLDNQWEPWMDRAGTAKNHRVIGSTKLTRDTRNGGRIWQVCRAPNMREKSAAVYKHANQIDMQKALTNLAWEQVEDAIYGTAGAYIGKTTGRATGSPFGVLFGPTF